MILDDAKPGSSRPSPWGWLELAVIASVSALVVAWNLDAQWIVGDELNAIHYLRPDLFDYLRSFHYGNTIKLQVWTLHHFFGHDFGWYRVPAAIAAVVACCCLLLPRPAWRPVPDFSVLLAVFLMMFNGPFLFFARWGMPNYAEGIAASAMLLGLILRDLVRGPEVRWSVPKLLLICLLPWLYPATVILLGGITVFLGLALWPSLMRQGRSVRTLGSRIVHASVPLLLGTANFAVNVALRSTEDWERARAHHVSFSSWASEVGGDQFGFIAHGTRSLFSDLATTSVSGSGPFADWFSTGYRAAAVAAMIAMLVAPALAGRNRLGPRAAAATALLRSLGILTAILVSTLAVTSVAALFDAFPIGKVRYVFFLLPVLGFATVLSVAYVGTELQSRFRAAWPVCAGIAVVALVCMSAIGFGVLAKKRGNIEQKQSLLLETLSSPLNRAVVSWDPGFFFPDALLPGSVELFNVGAERRVPLGLDDVALGARAGDGASRLVFFSRSGRLLDQSGRLVPEVSRFMDTAGYTLSERLDGGTHQVVVFSPEGPTRGVGITSINTTLDLPSGPILSIRIQPTERRLGRVAFDTLALETGGRVETIDLCSERGLQLVRTSKLQRREDGACVFRFGDGNGTGWIAPDALRKLDTAGTRRLHLAMSGDLGFEARLYMDLGKGYRSKDMLVVPTTRRPASIDREPVASTPSPTRN